MSDAPYLRPATAHEIADAVSSPLRYQGRKGAHEARRAPSLAVDGAANGTTVWRQYRQAMTQPSPRRRPLLQRRLTQLDTGKRSTAPIPIEAGPDDIRRHGPPSLEAQPGADLPYVALLAFVLVAEETMTQKKLVAATSPEVIAANLSAPLVSGALGDGRWWCSRHTIDRAREEGSHPLPLGAV